MRGLGLLRTVNLVHGAALLQGTTGCVVAEMRVLTHTGIVHLGLLQGLFYRLGGFGAGCFLDFAEYFRAFGGDLLAQRRAEKLQQPLDLSSSV